MRKEVKDKAKTWMISVDVTKIKDGNATGHWGFMNMKSMMETRPPPPPKPETTPRKM